MRVARNPLQLAVPPCHRARARGRVRGGARGARRGELLSPAAPPERGGGVQVGKKIRVEIGVCAELYSRGAGACMPHGGRQRSHSASTAACVFVRRHLRGNGDCRRRLRARGVCASHDPAWHAKMLSTIARIGGGLERGGGGRAGGGRGVPLGWAPWRGMRRGCVGPSERARRSAGVTAAGLARRPDTREASTRVSMDRGGARERSRTKLTGDRLWQGLAAVAQHWRGVWPSPLPRRWRGGCVDADYMWGEEVSRASMN
jgi:hypothetical protein